jgi:hypothetical protein
MSAEEEPTKINTIIINQVIDLFEQKEFQKKLIKKLNESVDIPFINEKTEKKTLTKMYDLLILAMKELAD